MICGCFEFVVNIINRECHVIVRWLQGRGTHFLCHGVMFCIVSRIYMILRCHKINNMSNLWLDLNLT
jgi:hypothetical protein